MLKSILGAYWTQTGHILKSILGAYCSHTGGAYWAHTHVPGGSKLLCILSHIKPTADAPRKKTRIKTPLPPGGSSLNAVEAACIRVQPPPSTHTQP